MSKIVSLIILATIASSLCHGGFLVQVEEPVTSIPKWVVNTEQFVVGLYSGVGLFANLPHQQACINSAFDQEIYNRILDVANVLAGLNSKSDFFAVFKQVAEDVAVLLSKFQQTQTTCVPLAGDYKEVFTQLLSYITNPEYLQKVSEHALFNIGGFQERAQKTTDAIKAGNFSEAGRLIGDIVNFALFWDFKVKF
jgi:hypothetical protein